MVKLYPGVAQLVARMVRVHEAVGSTPATRTNPTILVIVGFSLYFNGFSRFWMVKIFSITIIKKPKNRSFIFDFTNGFTNEKPPLQKRGVFALFGLQVIHIAPALGWATDNPAITTHFGVIVIRAGTAIGIDST